jgi:hypothetical protein
MNRCLTLIALVATGVSYASWAEDSIVLAKTIETPHVDCAKHPNCEDLQWRWRFRVVKQLKGPKVPRTVFAIYYRDDDEPPTFFENTTGLVLVVLTPIADVQFRKKMGADFNISEMSYIWHMYCLESPPSKYGLDTPENEIYILPGTDTKCFPTFWAGTP